MERNFSLVQFGGPFEKEERQMLEEAVQEVVGNGQIMPEVLGLGALWHAVKVPLDGTQYYTARRLHSEEVLRAESMDELVRKLRESMMHAPPAD